MPLLKLRCAKCGNVFEELLPAGVLSAACPVCGGMDCERAYEGKCYFSMKSSAPPCPKGISNPTCGGGCSCGNCRH
jgi:putative FmdB family regulatory protein